MTKQTTYADADINYSDLVKPETVANDAYYQALMRHMRTNNPVALVQSDTHKDFRVVSRHADIIEIERQNDIFLNTQYSVLQSKEIEAGMEANQGGLRTLIHLDDPEHKQYRDLTRDWFMPQNLKKLEARVRELARHTVDQMLALGEELDFARDVAVWYPLRVIMMILGVPESDEPKMLKLTQELFGADDPDMQRKAETEEERMQTLLEFFEYFTAMTADRRAHPKDDVASVIANAKIDGSPIGDIEAMSYYIIVATAGHDTTSSSTAGGLHALIEHPDEFKKVRDDPSVVPTAVEEAIRWVTPVKHFMRYGTQDYELRGVKIKAGEPLMMLYPSGNRDEEVFDDPDKFKADRKPNRHLAFGHGAHHCLGNLLAKMEMRYLYEEMFSRIASIELNGEPKLMHSTFVSGLKALPVRIKPK